MRAGGLEGPAHRGLFASKVDTVDVIYNKFVNLIKSEPSVKTSQGESVRLIPSSTKSCGPFELHVPTVLFHFGVAAARLRKHGIVHELFQFT
eukprot:5035507-Amphidinium_carterae.1